MSLAFRTLLLVKLPILSFLVSFLRIVLWILLLGATQLTAVEMLQVLVLQELKETVHKIYGILAESLQQPSNVTLDLANAVFLNPSYPVKNTFKTGIERFYNAR